MRTEENEEDGGLVDDAAEVVRLLERADERVREGLERVLRRGDLQVALQREAPSALPLVVPVQHSDRTRTVRKVPPPDLNTVIL